MDVGDVGAVPPGVSTTVKVPCNADIPRPLYDGISLGIVGVDVAAPSVIFPVLIICCPITSLPVGIVFVLETMDDVLMFFFGLFIIAI